MLVPIASLLLAGFAALAGAAGASAPLQDGKAKELLDGAAALMKEASAVSFENEVRLETGGMEIVQKAKVLLQRPDRARLDLSGSGQDALLVWDGETAWHYMKLGKGFVRSKQLGTKKLEQYGAGPAATLFFAKGVGELAPYLVDAVVTTEKLGEETCDVVTWKVGSEESRLWIGAKRLRRFQSTRSLNGQKFAQTIDYGAFNLAPKIGEDSFLFGPPKGAHPLDSGDETWLLDVGADLPEFTTTKLDETPLKGSDFKGRPLLVTFWFYG